MTSRSAPARIPLDRPLLGREESAYLTDAIRSGWLSWQGFYVRQLEKEFARYCKSRFAISMSTGSAALQIALQALGVKAGDEVIVPTLTFSATAFAASLTGAKVVFADTTPGRLTIEPEDAARRITRRTRAIVVVHLYGRPVDMDPLMRIARKHGIPVVEDAAEAPGARYKGRPVGALGTLGCFSFHNKLMASGEGGMITGNDPALAERIRSLKNPSPDNRTAFTEIAMNHRMSNLHAAVGLAQLRRLERVIAAKRKIAGAYDRHLRRIKGVETLLAEKHTRSVYWRYSMLVTDEFPVSRDELVKRLADRGIESRAIFLPMHTHPYYRGASKGRYPYADDLSRRGLDLPTSPLLTDRELRRVVAEIASIGRGS